MYHCGALPEQAPQHLSSLPRWALWLQVCHSCGHRHVTHQSLGCLLPQTLFASSFRHAAPPLPSDTAFASALLGLLLYLHATRKQPPAGPGQLLSASSIVWALQAEGTAVGVTKTTAALRPESTDTPGHVVFAIVLLLAVLGMRRVLWNCLRPGGQSCFLLRSCCVDGLSLLISCCVNGLSLSPFLPCPRLSTEQGVGGGLGLPLWQVCPP